MRRNLHDAGQSLGEYAMLLLLIAVLCVATVAALGGSISDFFASAASSI